MNTNSLSYQGVNLIKVQDGKGEKCRNLSEDLPTNGRLYHGLTWENTSKSVTLLFN